MRAPEVVCRRRFWGIKRLREWGHERWGLFGCIGYADGEVEPRPAAVRPSRWDDGGGGACRDRSSRTTRNVLLQPRAVPLDYCPLLGRSVKPSRETVPTIKPIRAVRAMKHRPLPYGSRNRSPPAVQYFPPCVATLSDDFQYGLLRHRALPAGAQSPPFRERNRSTGNPSPRTGMRGGARRRTLATAAEEI